MFRNIGKKEDYVEITHFDDNLYRIEWDYRPVKINVYDSEDSEIIETVDDEVYASWQQEIFTRKPDISEIKSMILTYFDTKTKNKITNGFQWTGKNGEIITPKLTQENQFNYKAAYDLALQTNGSSLPFTVKYGDISEPMYYEFTTVDDFSNFYSSCITFINTCIQDGWAEKDSIDWTKYEIQ